MKGTGYNDSMVDRQLGKHFIREWRLYRGYSLRRLASMMEHEPGEQITSHANLGRIETYRQPYTQDILEAIADALQVSVTSLLTVDPTKDGEVVDLMRIIQDKDRDTVLAMLRALPSRRPN